MKAFITDEGLTIKYTFFKPRFIPWKEVQCLDLSGLETKNYDWIQGDKKLYKLLSKGNARSRSFSLMSENHKLLKSCGGINQIWLAGINVLAITEIQVECALSLIEVLKQIASQNQIKLDIIVLEY